MDSEVWHGTLCKCQYNLKKQEMRKDGARCPHFNDRMPNKILKITERNNDLMLNFIFNVFYYIINCSNFNGATQLQ